MNELVNAINGEFGTLSYCPVHYHQRELSSEEYMALLCIGDVFLNTTERDSLPSVCLDYLLCQENGSLIVSEFTAIAQLIPEIANVNPWHTIVPLLCVL